VRPKYKTFSPIRIVALRSVNKIFPESYDFSAIPLLVYAGVRVCNSHIIMIGVRNFAYLKSVRIKTIFHHFSQEPCVHLKGGGHDFTSNVLNTTLIVTNLYYKVLKWSDKKFQCQKLSYTWDTCTTFTILCNANKCRAFQNKTWQTLETVSLCSE
jgi:hypothetical protein